MARTSGFPTRTRWPCAGLLVAVLLLTAPPLGAQGVLVVESEPRGALVNVDGARVGQAPLQRQLAAGPHVLETQFAGYRTDERAIEISDGDTLRVRIDLEQLFGRVRLREIPPDARVFVGGAPAPDSVAAAGVGRVPVQVVRDGWRDVTILVSVVPEATTMVTYDPTRQFDPRIVTVAALAPGLVPLRDNRPLWGTLILGATAGTIGTALVMQGRAETANREQVEAADAYRAATTEREVEIAREASMDAASRYRQSTRVRDVALSALAVTYAVSVVDVFLNHSRRAGLRTSGPSQAPQVGLSDGALTLRVQL